MFFSNFSTKAWHRHAFTMVFLAGLVWLFTLGREGMHPVHLWNRAFADASFVLLSLTLVIGPLVKFFPQLGKLIPWRRELGIWCAAAATIHVAIYAQAFDWNVVRFFVRETDEGTTLLRNAFGVANVVGLAALLYLVPLTVTSNNFSMQLLGRGWKFLQQQSYTLFVLTSLHALGFFYFVYQPNGQHGTFWLMMWSGILLTIAFQILGYVSTVRQSIFRRKS